MSAPDHSSTPHPSPIDIDALAAWLIEYRHPIQNALTRPDDGLTMLRTDRNFFVCHDALTDAAALVASSWLAGVIKSVQAQALRDFADFIEGDDCPHEPEEHGEGTCELCDWTFALHAEATERADQLIGADA